MIQREDEALAKSVEDVRERLGGRSVVLAVGRELHWFQPEILLRVIESAGIALHAIVLLDFFTEEQRVAVTEGLGELTSAPILRVDDLRAEVELRAADFIFTTHELTDPSLRQILIGALPSVGWAMERALIEDMEHVLYRHRSRGGLIYG